MSEAQKAKAAAGSSAPAPVQQAKEDATPSPKVDYPPRPESHVKEVAAQADKKEGGEGGPFIIKKELEQDPVDAQPEAGATCKRSGCHATYAKDMDRSAEECVFHPGTPIFHEGSKVCAALSAPSKRRRAQDQQVDARSTTGLLMLQTTVPRL